ncbi:hypothetical protein [Streptomyces sp. NPDC002889]
MLGAPASDAEFYRLVSSQGLYVQGDGHVGNPLIGNDRELDP